MSPKNIGSIPVYQKAQSLHELSRHLVSYISYNKDLVKLCQSNSLRDNITHSLLTDVRLIAANVTEALSTKSYSKRLQSTNAIPVMIRNISSYCRGLEKDGLKEKEYLSLLQNEIKGFRTIFKNWTGSLPNLD